MSEPGGESLLRSPLLEGAEPLGPNIKSVLVPESSAPLLFAMLASLAGHVGCLVAWGVWMVVGAVLVAPCRADPPPVDVTRTIEVAMVPLPRSRTAMPDRAARVAVQAGVQQAATPPPVRESDLAFLKEHPEQVQGDPELARRRDEMLAELQRQQLLEELMDAPTGAADRDATDPNGTTDYQVASSGHGTATDPELAAYIAKLRQLFQQHFHPLGALVTSNPDIECSVLIRMDDGGRITEWSVVKSSGNMAYDTAAERAVQEVGVVPLPPEKYLAHMAEGYTVKFTPPGR